MAYRYGEDIKQQILFPKSIDEYVGMDHPVRAYNAFVDTLDFSKIGIEIDEHKVGNSNYHPKSMLKLILYGYSYGVRSSRKLEREVYNNVTFMWLMRRLTPDHKTIAEFRRQNKKAIKEVLKLCVRVCVELDLIEGNVLFVDGTKVRANASRQRNHTREWYETEKGKIEERIERLLEECERIDEEESNQGSLVKMNKEIASATELKAAVEKALKKVIEEEQIESRAKERTINLTDNESAIMRSVQGSHASYNVQNVVDDKNGLIVNTDAVKATSDANQFAEQILQAEGTLEKQCAVACADAGYADTEELMKIVERGTTVIVPSQRQVLRKGEREFSKSKFKYDKENDCYVCPEGHKLACFKERKKRKNIEYRVIDFMICQRCRHYGICTKSKTGRNIMRKSDEEDKERIEKIYEKEESQAVYRRRKQRVEHPFGHMKHNLGITNFLLRGRNGAQAEASIGATCFNIVRMIRLCGGVKGLIERLAALKV